MKKSSDLDILHGPIVKNLFIFILPLLLTNMLQTFYSSADMFIVSLSDEEGAIGAIGSTLSLLHFLLCICVGFSFGTGIVVARRIGEQNPDSIQKAVHTSILLSVFAGILFMIISLLVCKPVLIWMNIRGNMLHLATLYTTITSIGVPFVTLTNCLIAIFRAKGDTKTPLEVLSVTGLINVGLNLFFVLSFKMSVDGVALATVISNILSSFFLIFFLNHDNGYCGFSFKKLHFDYESFKLILVNGIPSAFSSALFSLSNILIQSCIVGLNNTICPNGSAVLDGHAASTTVENFANQVSVSSTQAAITFVSQHYGAKDTKRMKNVIQGCYMTSGILCLVVSCIGLLIQKPVFNLFVSDKTAFDTAILRTSIFLFPYLAEVYMEMGSGILRGLNRATKAAIITLLGACVIRIIYVFTIFKAHPTLTCIYLSYPITWVITSVSHLISNITEYQKFKTSNR